MEEKIRKQEDFPSCFRVKKNETIISSNGR